MGPPGAPLLVQNSSKQYKPVVPCGWFILIDEVRQMTMVPSSNLSPTLHAPSCQSHADTPTPAPQYVMSPSLCGLEGITATNLSSSRIQYPSLILSLKITRKPTFYLWNVVRMG